MATVWDQFSDPVAAGGSEWDKVSDPVKAPAVSKESLVASNPGEYDPASPEYQAKYGPQSDSFFKNAAAAAGRFAVEQGKGLLQAGADAFDPFGVKRMIGMPSPLTDVARTRQQVTEQAAQDAPLLNARGGTTGTIAGGVLTGALMSPIPGVGTSQGATALGAAMGATQPVGTGESRGMNTLKGGAAGAVGQAAGQWLAGKVADKVAQIRAPRATQAAASAGPAGLNSAERAAMQAGESVGMKFTPGQRAGSTQAQKMEAWLEAKPFTSGPFDAIGRNNRDAVARAAAKAIGETSDTLDSAVLAKATDRMSNVFNSVRDETARAINPDSFIAKLASIEDEFGGVTQFQSHPLVQRLFALAEKGQATGRELGGLSSKLGRVAAGQMTSANGDRELGKALFQIKEIADDLVEQGLSGAKLAEYAAVRGQWRNLALLTSRTGIINPSNGSVNGRVLANVLQAKDKAGFLRGGNTSDMYQAARAAQAFPPVVGNSGTATRMGPADMLTSAPTNALAWAYLNAPGVVPLLRAPGVVNNALQSAALPVGNALVPALNRAGAIVPAVAAGRR